jgi:hypothetical protein
MDVKQMRIKSIIGAAILAAALAVAGCGGAITPEQEKASAICPSWEASLNGECKTVAAAEHAKHNAEVEKEAKEVDAIIKKRQAERTAEGQEREAEGPTEKLLRERKESPAGRAQEQANREAVEGK